MSENQKLREALQVAHDHIDMWSLEISHCKDAALIREALALPTADHIHDTGKMINGLTQSETDASASVSGLTGAPVGEREAFEAWLGITPCGAAHDFGWAAWQARAALSAGDAVDAGKFHKLFEAMDEGRASIIVEGATESIDGGEIFTDIDDALDAIDAAMRKGQL